MKQISIVSKVEEGAVCLYIRSVAPQVRILRERIEPAIFVSCDTERLPHNGVVLYTGTPDTVTSGCYLYRDETVDCNGLYYYWITELWEDGETLCHPMLVRVRDWTIWWPRDHYRRVMQEIAAQFPKKVSIHTCGYTTRGYPMAYLQVGRRDNVVMYLGAVHAGESGPEILLSAVQNLLLQDPALFDRTGVAILPAVNADHREDQILGCPQYLRTNPNGVDINRNFPAEWETVSLAYGLRSDCFMDSVYRGHSPVSEAETRAVLEMFEQVQPKLAFSCHWMASICEDHLLTSSTAEQDAAFAKRANEIRDIFCRGFDRVLAETLSPEEREVHYYCCGGSFSTYCYSRGVMAFDLEGGHRVAFAGADKDLTTREMLQTAIDCHTEAMREILTYLGK